MDTFYTHLFPAALISKWLSCGSLFSHREFSMTLPNGVYMRFNSFPTPSALVQSLAHHKASKLDIGAVYSGDPKFSVPVLKELVFDIDLTDYDDLRTCCSDANVCLECWELMKKASLCLDHGLRNDFGYKHILWVFSGRRGIHCWVCDEDAKKLDNVMRSAIVKYLGVDKPLNHPYVKFANSCGVFPRLDENVSMNINHLLKSPFCIHPQTLKLCVPIEDFEDFDPFTVPNLDELLQGASMKKYTDYFERFVNNLYL